MFPFYRMNIATLEYKLDLITNGRIPAISKDTDLVPLGEMKKIFCTTPAWKSQWHHVAMLLKTAEFKHLTVKERKAIKNKVDHDKLIPHKLKVFEVMNKFPIFIIFKF